MNVFSKLLARLPSGSSSWWEQFTVTCDHEGFKVIEKPWGKASIEHAAAWQDVDRVCFNDGGLATDSFYIFSQQAKEPILVPVEAKGGNDFWAELTSRGLFPQQVSAQATRSAVVGAELWWPPQ